MTPIELEAIRTAADVVTTAAVSIGLPWLGAWAVRKHLIQQRWAAMIEAAAAAGLNAGLCAGELGSPAFRVAAELEILRYAKSQASDVLASKGMTDAMTVEAGMARVSGQTGGVVGPAGLAPIRAAPAT